MDRQGQGDQQRRQPEDGREDERVFRPRAVRASHTGWLGLEIDLPETEADEDDGHGREIGLVGLERREGSDPCAGNAQGQKQEGRDAAGRCADRANDAAGREPALLSILGWRLQTRRFDIVIDSVPRASFWLSMFGTKTWRAREWPTVE